MYVFDEILIKEFWPSKPVSVVVVGGLHHTL